MSERLDALRRGYPLAALFVLLAAAAALSAFLAPVFRHVVEGNLEFGNVVGSMIILALLTGTAAPLVRLFTSRRLRDLLIAAAAGATVGVVGGAVLWIPANEINLVFISVSVGSAAIVAAAVLSRAKGIRAR